MRTENLFTKIFLDGGDPEETGKLMEELGFLDGQTTNPTLIAKNPEAQKRLALGQKFSNQEVQLFYRGVVERLSEFLPNGSISVEVYADKNTDSRTMVAQAKEMNGWINNAHIKLPITAAGLEAAAELVKEGLRVNMTLCFSQAQAAAVYAATAGAKKDQVFVSPFVGRLDDIGQNGMTLIENIKKMYVAGDGHVEILTASVRTGEHFLRALQIGSDIITAPYKILSQWAKEGARLPGEEFIYAPAGLTNLDYFEFDLGASWKSFNIQHDLTDKGLERFVNDWNGLIKF